MKKYIITKIWRGIQNTVNGPKPKIGVQVNQPEYAGKWVSSFQTKGTEEWKVGDEINIVIETKETPKGTFFNFSRPTENDLLELRVASLEREVKALRAFLVVPVAEKSPDDIEYPPEEDPSEIPF